MLSTVCNPAILSTVLLYCLLSSYVVYCLATLCTVYCPATMSMVCCSAITVYSPAILFTAQLYCVLSSVVAILLSVCCLLPSYTPTAQSLFVSYMHGSMHSSSLPCYAHTHSTPTFNVQQGEHDTANNRYNLAQQFAEESRVQFLFPEP